MVRQMAMATLMSAVLAGAGAAQQTVMASATILERVEAEAVEVSVRSAGHRLSVEQQPVPASASSRVLRSTFVEAAGVTGPQAVRGEGIPVRAGDGSMVRLERRTVHDAGGAELRSGTQLLIDRMEQLTVTRVIAANS